MMKAIGSFPGGKEMPIDDEGPINPEFKKRAETWDARFNTPSVPTIDKDDYAFDPDNYASITTAKELRDLKAERSKPTQQLNFDMDGTAADQVRKDIAEQNEQRIEYLNDTLATRAERFERDFDYASANQHRLDEDNDPEI